MAASKDHELARSAAAGDFAAGRRLLAKTMGLVVCIARRYAESGLPLRELIGSGNTALIRALQTFDPDRAIVFSVYAGWQVIQGIEWTQAQRHSPARLLGETLRETNACLRARRYLAANGYPQPEAEEIAYLVRSPVGRVRRVLDLDGRLADIG
ncbi:MAG: sigma factor [Betaproteobacteria bacterium]|nr:sigma factor [Betaproteobacteria bacterium]